MKSFPLDSSHSAADRKKRVGELHELWVAAGCDPQLMWLILRKARRDN